MYYLVVHTGSRNLGKQVAEINRKLIVDLLLSQEGYAEASNDAFESVHNYIGDDNIIRKGGIGKGYEDWNFSATHGAGRIMSRSQAFQQINMDDFAQSMKGIYNETVTEATKDESPMVYKPMAEILGNITDTVEVVNIIKPIFNYKAAE